MSEAALGFAFIRPLAAHPAECAAAAALWQE